MRVQSGMPEDTLFGRSVNESGFAVPLVVLGFAAFWLLPLLTSIVGGDLFSAEDRYGTWTTVLTRSRSRAELFGGKVVAALGFASLAIAALAVSSAIAGLLVIGQQPLVDCQALLPKAALRVGFAWVSVLPRCSASTAIAVLASVWTRSSAAGVGCRCSRR
jgi:ABC-2 type transport system permease protein